MPKEIRRVVIAIAISGVVTLVANIIINELITLTPEQLTDYAFDPRWAVALFAGGSVGVLTWRNLL